MANDVTPSHLSFLSFCILTGNMETRLLTLLIKTFANKGRGSVKCLKLRSVSSPGPAQTPLVPDLLPAFIKLPCRVLREEQSGPQRSWDRQALTLVLRRL